MTNAPSFGDYEFTDNHQIREYSQRVRKTSHVLGLEMALAAAELKAALEAVRPAEGGNVLGMNQKWRARQVARHYERASEALKAAAAAATKGYASFRRHYSPELDRVNGRSRPRRVKFEFKPE